MTTFGIASDLDIFVRNIVFYTCRKMAVSTTGADFFLLDDMAPVEDCGTGKRLVADFDGDGADDILCKTSGLVKLRLIKGISRFLLNLL